MIRFLLYVALGYFLYSLYRAVTRARRTRRPEPDDAPQPGKTAAPPFLNIKDAEFEELPPGDEPPASPKP
jgi:hypothetical protein